MSVTSRWLHFYQESRIFVYPGFFSRESWPWHHCEAIIVGFFCFLVRGYQRRDVSNIFSAHCTLVRVLYFVYYFCDWRFSGGVSGLYRCRIRYLHCIRLSFVMFFVEYDTLSYSVNAIFTSSIHAYRCVSLYVSRHCILHFTFLIFYHGRKWHCKKRYVLKVYVYFLLPVIRT